MSGLGARGDKASALRFGLGRQLPPLLLAVDFGRWGWASSRPGRWVSDQRRPNPRRWARGPRAFAGVIEDALDEGRLRNEANDAHLGSAPRAHQWVHLVHPPDQIRPAAPQRRPLGRRGDMLVGLARAVPLEPILSRPRVTLNATLNVIPVQGCPRRLLRPTASRGVVLGKDRT
jgi:hypothetical protein